MNNYYHAATRRFVTASEFAALKAAEVVVFEAPPPRYRFTGDIEGSILDGDEEKMEGNF